MYFELKTTKKRSKKGEKDAIWCHLFL